MTNFWDARFAVEEYVYGTEPNSFFKQEIEKLPAGKILMPGEGEGRNAVFAATLGWDVTAFDSSIEGKKKAEKLAESKNVQINYLINNYENIQLPENDFDCIGLVFTHVPLKKRREYHRKYLSSLKPGGHLIMECYSKEQIHNDTGGPRDIDMLFSEEELHTDFESCSKLSIVKEEIYHEEGQFHVGNASVIRIVAEK
ncbi:MAG TPA: class I SAM-dependent methyltransferase [Sunxiuqinia sp.]|nr:class I SAM-dependent methyltransferase [Sunxiuqinia sp.]